MSLLLLALLASPAELRVLDAATGRGVPLVELETTHGERFVTDNAGRVALPDRTERFFHVTAHGYAVPKDGLGVAGLRVTPPATVRLNRLTVAERLGRLTGADLHRDSRLLGHPTPPANPGRVAGQDSVQHAVYRGRAWWFWGDTSRLDYPLGLFRTAGATTALPLPDPADGLRYDTFTDAKTGFARAMMPLPERPDGVIWIFGVCVVPDAAGVERLVGHYSRRKGLAEEFEHGVCVWDDAAGVFKVAKQLPPAEKWRHPAGNPVLFEEAGERWLLFGSPCLTVRVPASYEAVLDPTKYEALALTAAVGPAVPDAGAPNVRHSRTYRWQKELPPADSKREQEAVRAGDLKATEAHFLPVGDDGKPVVLHSGTVRWNEYRQRWVLLAGQIGGTSFLGEVWYSEADHPTGPFRRAVKVATHDRQSFYNVAHFPALDRGGGRVVHFEGTYTRDFSGNPLRTARYDYNQLLYRLDLADERLKAAGSSPKR